MPSLQSTAALARLDGLTAAFMEREDVRGFIRQFPSWNARDLSELIKLTAQYFYGEGRADEAASIANHVQELLEGKPDAD